MEGSLKELSKYRFEKAQDMLKAAENNFNMNDLRTALNRSYYAIFHAIRAVNILDEFDSSKHTGVIAYFNQFYVKNGRVDEKLSDIIKNSSYLREKSDYDDFYIASRHDAEEQIENAKEFLENIEVYLKGKGVI